jgi:hypothetical protein
MKKLSKKLLIKFLKNNGAYPEELRYARRHWPEKVAITPNFLAKASAAGINSFYPKALPGKLEARLRSAYDKANKIWIEKGHKASALYSKRTAAACAAYEAEVASIEKAYTLEKDKALCDVLQDLLGDERKAGK